MTQSPTTTRVLTEKYPGDLLLRLLVESDVLGMLTVDPGLIAFLPKLMKDYLENHQNREMAAQLLDDPEPRPEYGKRDATLVYLTAYMSHAVPFLKEIRSDSSSRPIEDFHITFAIEHTSTTNPNPKSLPTALMHPRQLDCVANKKKHIVGCRTCWSTMTVEFTGFDDLTQLTDAADAFNRRMNFAVRSPVMDSPYRISHMYSSLRFRTLTTLDGYEIRPLEHDDSGDVSSVVTAHDPKHAIEFTYRGSTRVHVFAKLRNTDARTQDRRRIWRWSVLIEIIAPDSRRVEESYRYVRKRLLMRTSTNTYSTR